MNKKIKDTAIAAAMLLACLPAKAQQSAPTARPLADYRNYADEPVADWRASNDTVGKIGGWRAYAREAHEARKQREAAATAAQSAPVGAKP